MALETRFARAPGGPVPYRVDGAGDRQLVLVSDWKSPYGAPGAAAFEPFVVALAARGVTTTTVLDGSVRAGASPPAIDERVAAARAVMDAEGVARATLLGAGGGAPSAALLAAAEPGRFDRLILYDTFAADTAPTWALANLDGGQQANRLPGASAPMPPTPAAPDAETGTPAPPSLADLEHLKEMEAGLKAAGQAFDWAARFYREHGGRHRRDRAAEIASGDEAPGPDDVFARQLLPAAAAALGPEGPFGPAIEQWGMPRGVAEILSRVAKLEERFPAARASLGLAGIQVPTLVLEARQHGTENGTLGIEIAAEIPGARHRLVDGSSRWPWGEPGLDAGMLDAPGLALPAPQTAPRASAEEAPERVLATILFTDIVKSTERLAALGDAAWRELLERHHAVVRGALAEHGGREIDTAGDGFLAAFDAPARGVRCAMAIRQGIRGIGLSIRAGLHTGECERVGAKLVGIAVHIGARIASQAAGDEILVSATVRDLVAGSGIAFASRGTATLKGLPGEWTLFAVEPKPAAEAR